MKVNYQRDPIGGSVWAFPDNDGLEANVALVWFTGSERVMYVLNPFVRTGSWVTIENPKYDNAASMAEFGMLAQEFFETTEVIQ